MLIYKAENIQNGNIYIGKTINTLDWRRYHHEWKSDKKDTTYFHNAIIKYGKDNFSWTILDSTAKTEEELIEQEKFFIMLYKANGYKLYNLTNGGEGTIGYKQSKETIEKIRKSNTGRKHSAQTKIKISQIQKELKSSLEYRNLTSKRVKKDWDNKERRINTSIKSKNRWLNEEYRKKMSIDKRGKNHFAAKPVMQLSLNGILLNTFESGREAARILNLHQASINRCCKGLIKTSGKFIWKYA